LRYSFLARNHEPPGERSLWTKRQEGPFWSIWEYRPSPLIAPEAAKRARKLIPGP
jgi:hypothetical protein